MTISGFQLDFHSRNSGCFVISSIQNEKWTDHYFSTKQVSNDSEKTDLLYKKNYSKEPHYISVNTFKGKRCIDNVLYFNSFYADIDCGFDQKAHALNEIYKNIRLKLIPPPNKIVDSGRGYHIYWYIHQIAKTENHDYKIEFCAFQKHLTKTLEYIGADHKAIDPARVLRLEGSLNLRTGTRVQVIHSDPVQHNFFDLINHYLGTSKKVPKNTIHKSIEKNIEYRFSKLHSSRLKDFKTIISYFNKKYILSGYRGLLLFYLSLSLFALFRDINYIRNELGNYNDSFLQKLPESQLQAILSKTSEYQSSRKLYTAKTTTIISALALPPDLQRKLSNLIGRDEKSLRLTEKRRKEGVVQRSIYIALNHEKTFALLERVLQLKNKGKNNSKIARELGFSRQYISKLHKMSTGLSL